MATWNPAAIYGAFAALPDAELLRWALEEAASDAAHHAEMARDSARLHGPRAKPRLSEADAYQALSDRLAGAAGVLVTGIARCGKAAVLDGDLLHLVGELVATAKAERASFDAMTVEQQGAFHHGPFVQHYVHGIRSPIETVARAIAHIPARTPEGIQAKARALLWWQGGSDAGPLLAIGNRLWDSLLADMTGTPCRFPFRPSTPESAA